MRWWFSLLAGGGFIGPALRWETGLTTRCPVSWGCKTSATMYAVLFRRSPAELDWSLSNEAGASEGDWGSVAGFYVHEPHLGEHLPTTPEKAGAVNKVTWEVVSGHPYTGLKAE